MKTEKYTTCKLCSSEIELINKKYELVKCVNCKLIFSQKIFTEQEIIDTYDKLYNKSSQYKSHIQEFENIKNNKNFNVGRPKKKILKFLLNNNVKNICEIGAGVGIIANYLKNKNVNYTGIEIDKSTALRAKELQLNVINESFLHLNNFENSFDAIVGFEVFEHIQELNDLFILAKKALTNNGYIAFTVPNYDKIKNYKNVGEKIHQDIPPIHLNFFNIENVNLILEMHGYEVLVLETKKFPYLNLNKKDTYKFIFKSFFNKFYGQTLICIAQKK